MDLAFVIETASGLGEEASLLQDNQSSWFVVLTAVRKLGQGRGCGSRSLPTHDDRCMQACSN